MTNQTLEQAIVAQMQKNRAKTQAAQPPQDNATASGSLEIVRKDNDGTLIAIAEIAEKSTDIPGLCRRAAAFCAKAGEISVELDGRDYSVVASWYGAPMIRKGGELHALGADDKLDPSRVVGIAIGKGSELAHFVTLQPIK